MDYPIWDIGIGGGMLMAIVAIAHVIVSHFAIGGGLLIVVSEALAARREDPELRDLARRASLVLVLVSTVFGAISGVGIWVVAGLGPSAAGSALGDRNQAAPFRDAERRLDSIRGGRRQMVAAQVADECPPVAEVDERSVPGDDLDRGRVEPSGDDGGSLFGVERGRRVRLGQLGVVGPRVRARVEHAAGT